MPLSVSRGKVHEYLGMMFDFTTTGEVCITKYQYVTGVVNDAPVIYKQGAGGATPAPPNLYEVRDPGSESTELSQHNCCTFQKELDQIFSRR